jgi:hypothetical protein
MKVEDNHPVTRIYTHIPSPSIFLIHESIVQSRLLFFPFDSTISFYLDLVIDLVFFGGAEDIALLLDFLCTY